MLMMLCHATGGLWKLKLNALVHRSMGFCSIFVDLSLAQSHFGACADPHVKDFPLADKSSLASTAANMRPLYWKYINWLKLYSMSLCTISEDAAFSPECAQTTPFTA